MIKSKLIQKVKTKTWQNREEARKVISRFIKYFSIIDKATYFFLTLSSSFSSRLSSQRKKENSKKTVRKVQRKNQGRKRWRSASFVRYRLGPTASRTRQAFAGTATPRSTAPTSSWLATPGPFSATHASPRLPGKPRVPSSATPFPSAKPAFEETITTKKKKKN